MVRALRSAISVNLTVPQLRILQALAAAGADVELTLAELGAKAGLQGAAGGGECRALQARGLVERLELDIDGKLEVSYVLTDAGRAALRSVPQAGAKMVAPKARAEASAALGNGAATVKALVPLYGSNRLLASEVGLALDGCQWVGIPFMGSLAELPAIKARTVVANDLHKHLVHLAMVTADPVLGPALWRAVRRLPLSDVVLKQSQERCDETEPDLDDLDVSLAAAYWHTAWAARNGQCGTKKEFTAPLSLRWDAGGGDSAVRLRNAATGLRAWRALLGRVTFCCMDCFAFLAKCKDQRGHGVYCDPPFPGPGDKYKHAFDDRAHRQLAVALGSYAEARIVCRFYDVPVIRQLYQERRGWEWRRIVGRKASNALAPEVLLVKN